MCVYIHTYLTMKPDEMFQKQCTGFSTGRRFVRVKGHIDLCTRTRLHMTVDLYMYA